MSAFIKQYSAKNGATVIQVVFKRGRVVEKTIHVGTAHNKTQIAELRCLAQEIIHEGQLPLPLFDEENGVGLCVSRTYSKLLFDTLGRIYDELGFDKLKDPTYRKLVISRIIEPTSKLDTVRVLDDLGLAAPSNATIHRALKRSIEKDYRAILAKACFEHADMSLVTLLLYDVTTLYFEIQKEDGYRMSGLSKERRLDPQITVGLLVTPDGFPLEVASFEGNRAEVHTILEVLDTFKRRHGLIDLTVTADAAMLSTANLSAIRDAGYHYIIASRNAKTPYHVQEYLNETKTDLEDGQIFEGIWDMNAGGGGPRRKERVIYQYRAARCAMDLINIDKRLEKAKRMVAGDMPVKRNQFLKITGAKREINYDLVKRQRLCAGIKGYVTDLDIDAAQAIDAYHQLFEVERSFRMCKSDLKARPAFHQTRDSIEAHLTIVFAALAIARRASSKMPAKSPANVT